jgi:hypothetical protein
MQTYLRFLCIRVILLSGINRAKEIVQALPLLTYSVYSYTGFTFKAFWRNVTWEMITSGGFSKSFYLCVCVMQWFAYAIKIFQNEKTI